MKLAIQPNTKNTTAQPVQEFISSLGGNAFAPEPVLARRATRRIASHVRKERNAVQRQFSRKPPIGAI